MNSFCIADSLDPIRGIDYNGVAFEAPGLSQQTISSPRCYRLTQTICGEFSWYHAEAGVWYTQMLPEDEGNTTLGASERLCVGESYGVPGIKQRPRIWRIMSSNIILESVYYWRCRGCHLYVQSFPTILWYNSRLGRNNRDASFPPMVSYSF